MKKELGFLAIGITAGILFTRSNQSVPTIAPIESPVVVEVPAVAAESKLEKIQVRSEIKHLESPITMTPDQSLAAKRALLPQPYQKDPKRLKLTISEETIGSLEESETQLKNLVYTEVTDLGWMIHVLQEDNLLTQAGIQDGDEITHESLSASDLEPEKIQLANRMVRFLNSIRR